MRIRTVIRTLLRRPRESPEEAAYRRIKKKGFSPGSIIDVGAYEGNWTRLARRVFDGTPVLMVEPQPGKSPYLERVCSELRYVRFASALVASRAGQSVTFHQMETGSSIFPERSSAPRSAVRLTTTTLDRLAGDMAGPIFLKVDVQGAELEVLQGAPEVLARCELVQLEVALVPYNEGAPTILEVLSWMDAMGFVPLDISDFSRPNGVDLAQIDLLFTPKSSPLRRFFFEF